MSKRRRAADSGLPLGPNETGIDPQYGNVEDLPPGVMRQTSVISCLGAQSNTPKKWARLVFSFPECLGIKQTLDNAAKKTSCIPTVDMDVPINLPIIKDCKIEIIKKPKGFTTLFTKTKEDNPAIWNKITNTDLAFILTGDDQLTDTANSVLDPTKTEKVATPEQIASLSDAIYAKFLKHPPEHNSYDDPDMIPSLRPPGFTGNGWLYGKTVGGVEGLSYAQVAQRYLKPEMADWTPFLETEINNIQKKGFLLLKDHVNLFALLPPNDIDIYDLRVTLDYQTRQVSLSSLLVWQQQLKEFIPKQVRWRVYKQPLAATKNGWNILISRGDVKESGVGNDPTSKTDFPDIKD